MKFRGGSVIITMAHAHKTVPCHPYLNQNRFLARERGLFRRIYYSRFLYHDYITFLPIPRHGLRPQNPISCRYRCKLSFVDSNLNSSAQEPTSLNQTSPERFRQQTDRRLPSFIEQFTTAPGHPHDYLPTYPFAVDRATKKKRNWDGSQS